MAKYDAQRDQSGAQPGDLLLSSSTEDLLNLPGRLFAVFTGITKCDGCFLIQAGLYGKWVTFDFDKSLCLCFGTPGLLCGWASQVFTGPVLEVYSTSDCTGEPLMTLTDWIAAAEYGSIFPGQWTIEMTGGAVAIAPTEIFRAFVPLDPCDEDFGADNSFTVDNCGDGSSLALAFGGSVAVTINGCVIP